MTSKQPPLPPKPPFEIFAWLVSNAPDFAELPSEIGRWGTISGSLRPFFNGSPLVWAIRNKHFELVESLAKHGAAIDQRDVYNEFEGKTPLEHACQWTMPRVVMDLLKAGADPFSEGNPESNYDAWHYAIAKFITRTDSRLPFMVLEILLDNELKEQKKMDYSKLESELRFLSNNMEIGMVMHEKTVRMRSYVLFWLRQTKLENGVLPGVVKTNSMSI